MEADDDGLYVAKYRGAGQGPAALVAEVVVGELARRLGLPVPELVSLGLRAELARAEPDPEIQDLLYASAGTNLGVDFLPGALPFTPAAVAAHRSRAGRRRGVARRPDDQRRPLAAQPEPARLARAHLADRSRRGALPPARLAPAGEHRARALPGDRRPRAAAGAAGRSRRPTSAWPATAQAALATAVALVPEDWLGEDPAGRRRDLADFLAERLRAPRAFVDEAEAARACRPTEFQYTVLRLVPVGRARRAHQRRRRRLLPPARLPPGARAHRRRAPGRARARPRPRRGAPGARGRSATWWPGTRPPARWRRCRPPSASAGSSRTPRRSSSRRRVTRG